MNMSFWVPSLKSPAENSISKASLDTSLQLLANYFSLISTTFESVKIMNFKTLNKFLSTFNAPEAHSKSCQLSEMDCLVRIVYS